MENSVRDTESCSLTNRLILAYIRDKRVLECPKGGIYTAGPTVADPVECSYHGNLDTMWNIAERRYSEEKRQGFQRRVSVSIALAVCGGACLLFSRRKPRTA
jgi:hypothetical protein